MPTTTDSALAVAIANGGGVASILLTSPGESKSEATRRVEAHPLIAGKTVTRATRASLSAPAIRAALKVLGDLGIAVVDYLENLGIVRVTGDPVVLASIRRLPFVDWIVAEPKTQGTTFAERMPARSTSAASFIGPQVVPWGVSMIRAPQAWPLTRGAGAKIFLIDTGYDGVHEDLFTIAAGNCALFVCGDLAQLPHGTFVGGILAARDNGVGSVGIANLVAPVDFYAYRVCTWNPSGGTTIKTLFAGGGVVCPSNYVTNAINWAIGHLGPRTVINYSGGSTVVYDPLGVAVAAAWANNMVIVSSAGNVPPVPTGTPVYPAAYSQVIAVTGVLQDTTFAAPVFQSGCSNVGSNEASWATVAAPFSTVSTLPGNQYGSGSDGWCGTSISSPFVAGTAALVWARNPTFTNGQVRTQITFTALDRGQPGHDSKFGFGVVRADLAVGLFQPTITASLSTGNRPRLTWAAVPMATSYRIWHRVTPTLAPSWILWGTVAGTTYTDTQTPATSFYGYQTYPGGSTTAVGYYVEAVSASGVGSGVGAVYATFIPSGTPPY